MRQPSPAPTGIVMPPRPDLTHERATGERRVAGVDEVGRGPLAGPVVAAAVVFGDAGPPSFLVENLRDSKQLSLARRRRLCAAILAAADVGIGAAAVREIDRINIHQAALLAMARAVTALPRSPQIALIDGPHAPAIGCRTQSLVGGDRQSLSIAAASIVAKVTRDRLMSRLAVRFPAYGWERNAGYGTAEHRAALHRCGPTAHHRRTFAPVRACLEMP